MENINSTVVLPKSHVVSAVATASVGCGLEIYDFMVYAFFAPIIAALFFPVANDLISLLDTFAVFAIGYFARPLGAILFGHFGDRIGRKKGMLVSIGIIALSTTLIGLLPTYSTIGIFAPVLLILFRFIQGIALGGDLPGAITFVAEYADDDKRGLLCGVVYCAVNLGLLLASAVGALLTNLLTHEALVAWGWRLAFLLGLIIAVVGFYLRTKIAETPYFAYLEKTKNISQVPVAQLFRQHHRQVLQGIGVVWLFAAIIAQIFIYMPTYFHTVDRYPLTTGLMLNSINLLILSLAIPVMGFITDKIGRKPMLLTITSLFIIFSYPLYHMLTLPSLSLDMFALACLALLAAGIVGSVPSVLSELFPTAVRYSGVAISYNIGFAIFAGLTPMIATYLIYKTQQPQAPSYYLIVSAIVAFLVSLTLPERSRQPLSNI